MSETQESPETPTAEPDTSTIAETVAPDGDANPLLVLRGTAIAPLQRLSVFPESFSAALAENLQLLIGEQPIVLGTWNPAEHADRPSLLGFDHGGSLLAVVLGDGSAATETRVAATVSWLQTLTLRDVLMMHTSVETLMDTLLTQNPDELHLTLGPERRVVLVEASDLGNAATKRSYAGVSEVVPIELFSGNGDEVILRRVVASESPEAPVAHTAAAVPEEVETTETTETAAITETIETPEGTETAEGTDTTGTVDTADTNVAPVAVAAGAAAVIATPAVVDLTGDAVAEQPVKSSLAPPPTARNTADDAAIEPGAVSFKPGTPMRSADLNAYLADKTGAPEEVAPGCVQSGKHVLLTEVLSNSRVLENRGHYHRIVGESAIERFREWYDGSIPKVTFHLLVQAEGNEEETTYVGRLKPTAWEHRAGAQNLLFRIVPRIGSDLWIVLSAGTVPKLQATVAAEEPEPWPVVPAEESAPTQRRRGVRRLR